MNEEQFRTRLRGALGEPPSSDLRRGLEARLTAGTTRHRSSLLGSLAATLALLTIAGAVGWRLAYLRTNVPATVKRSTATPTVVPTAASVNPLNCRLPVVVTREAGPPPGHMASEPGFVETQSRQYAKDNAASIAGLPGGAFEGSNAKASRAAAPSWYSNAVKRWLPVDRTVLAPDGKSYVWTRLLPAGSNIANFKTAELHRYDLTTASDRLLWTYAAYLNVDRWDWSGILVDASPPQQMVGTLTFWLIDPQTGAATQQSTVELHSGPTLLPGEGQHPFSSSILGTDAGGRNIYRFGGREAGDQEWVFFESGPGQRVTIYNGHQGDGFGFDPLVALGDGRGIWFGDFGTRGLWYWDPASGLHKLTLKGLPALLSGPYSSLYVIPAGFCM